jgi:DNA-binding SARP family transcriptional activator
LGHGCVLGSWWKRGAGICIVDLATRCGAVQTVGKRRHRGVIGPTLARTIAGVSDPLSPSLSDPRQGLQLRLMGAPAWRLAGSAWQALSRKDAALLCRLALEGAAPRTAMAAWLWPEVPASRAHANLRQRLYKLRQAAPAPLVEERGEQLALAGAVRADLGREGYADEADLDAVLLAGADATGEADAVQVWLDETRRQWLARRADALAGLAARHEDAGELAAAIAVTEWLLAAEPLLEHGWRRLMRLHALRGDRAAALAAFERCEQVLRDELGVRPAAETQALLHQVETGARPVLPGGPGPGPAGTLTAAGARPTAGGGLRTPPLLGRQAEWQALHRAWEAGEAFVLIGAAGQGKSRLMLALAATLPDGVIESARAGDEGVPYGALVRLLRTMARVAPRPDALWPAGPGAEIERRELARLLPDLGEPPPAPGLEALLQAALEQVFQRAPAAGLRAVLFDDLHHADDASRALLQRVAAQPGLQWGLASRPGGEALERWLASSARVRPVPLGGLDEAAVQALVLSCVPAAPDGEALAPAQVAARVAAQASALVRHCGGNPLFVLETLRQWLAPGAAPVALGDPLPLPPTVEAVLAQRLAALPAAAQSVAQVAAVAGPDFDAEVAADVLQQPLLTLAEPLAALEQAQVMAEGRFAHDMLQEAVLRQLPTALRRPLHARVARSLRQRGAPAARVAAHYTAGGLPGEAAPLAMTAAADARRLGRLGERVARLEDAVSAYLAAGEDEGALAARIELVSARFAGEGATDAVLESVDTLLAEALRGETRVTLYLLRAGLYLARYDLPGVRRSAAAALAEAEGDRDEALTARLLDAAAMAMAGEGAAAREAVQPLLARVQACADPLLATDLWGYLAVVYAHAGPLDEAIAALQAQRRLAREVGKADDESAALTSLCGQYAQRGDLELALVVGREAQALQQRIGAHYTLAGTQINTALAEIGLYQLDAALRTLAQVRQGFARVPASAELTVIVDDSEAEVWLRAGQPGRALALVAPDAAPEVSLPRRVGRRLLRARVFQALGRQAEALALWREVLQAPMGGIGLLRAHLLAVHALAGEADDRLGALCERAADQPVWMQALAHWVVGAAAQRRGDDTAALAAARSVRERLQQAQPVMLPQAELRTWLVRTLAELAPAEEAALARSEHGRWWAEAVLPHLPAGCPPEALPGWLPKV